MFRENTSEAVGKVVLSGKVPMEVGFPVQGQVGQILRIWKNIHLEELMKIIVWKKGEGWYQFEPSQVLNPGEVHPK